MRRVRRTGAGDEGTWVETRPIQRSYEIVPGRETELPSGALKVDGPVPLLLQWSVETERGTVSRGVGPPPWRASKASFEARWEYHIAWGPSVCVYSTAHVRNFVDMWWWIRGGRVYGHLAGIPLRFSQPKFGLRRDSRILVVEAEDDRVWRVRLRGIREFVLIRSREDQPVFRGSVRGGRRSIAWRRTAQDDEIVLGVALEELAGLMTLSSRVLI